MPSRERREDPPPAAAATDECLYWRRKFQKDYNGPDSKFVTSTQIAAVDVAFRLIANLRGNAITITSIFKWGTIDASITAAQKRRTIRKFKAKVAAWSWHVRMKIKDPVCGEKTLPVVFNLLWSPDDTADAAPYKVNLHVTYPRAGVTGWDIDIGYNDVTDVGGWVLEHEYGHTLCLPDEYFYGGVTAASVTYKKADGGTESVTLEPTRNNIMKTHGSTSFRWRFFYFAAIEAQELLRRESGHNVTCEII